MTQKNLIIEQILECWAVGKHLIVNGRMVVIDRVRWLASGGLEFRYKEGA